MNMRPTQYIVVRCDGCKSRVETDSEYFAARACDCPADLKTVTSL